MSPFRRILDDEMMIRKFDSVNFLLDLLYIPTDNDGLFMSHRRRICADKIILKKLERKCIGLLSTRQTSPCIRQ